MITLNNRKYEVIDAHAHVWKEFKGERFGDTPVEKIGNGRVRQNGEEFQFIPPEYQDYNVHLEVLQGYMDIAGVDRAVILQNPCYGDQRDYVSNIVRKSPAKFRGFGMLDPRKIDSVSEEIDTLIQNYHGIGIKMEIPDVPFVMDAPEYDFLWRKLLENDAIAAIDLGWGNGPYDFNIDRMRNVVKRYPDLKLMLCHLGVSRLWDLEQEYPYPQLQRTLSLLEINTENLYFDIAGMPVFDHSDEYPFDRPQKILKTVKETVGMDRIMWGSDFPTVMLQCTYSQSLEYITRHCDFLTEDDFEKLLGKNARRFLFRE